MWTWRPGWWPPPTPRTSPDARRGLDPAPYLGRIVRIFALSRGYLINHGCTGRPASRLNSRGDGINLIHAVVFVQFQSFRRESAGFAGSRSRRRGTAHARVAP